MAEASLLFLYRKNTGPALLKFGKIEIALTFFLKFNPTNEKQGRSELSRGDRGLIILGKFTGGWDGNPLKFSNKIFLEKSPKSQGTIRNPLN